MTLEHEQLYRDHEALAQRYYHVLGLYAATFLHKTVDIYVDCDRMKRGYVSDVKGHTVYVKLHQDLLQSTLDDVKVVPIPCSPLQLTIC